MVDLKVAVSKAMDFAKDSLGLQRTAGLRLEEIESSVSEGHDVWLITLSVAADNVINMFRGSGQIYGADAGREYKTFTVSKETGDVLSMKIRLLAVPN